ncbi:MAG: hypothetical protein ACI89X_000078 [Planctomycetota bacterium]|jgi:hypothetical protein
MVRDASGLRTLTQVDATWFGPVGWPVGTLELVVLGVNAQISSRVLTVTSTA